MLPTISFEGRIVGEPGLRFIPSGAAVWKARVVAEKKKKNDQDEWVNDKEFWANVTTWRQTAENCAESFKAGDLVVVTGTVETRDYEVDGVKRTAVEVEAFAVGPSMRFRNTPHGSQGGGQERPAGGSGGAGRSGGGPSPQRGAQQPAPAGGSSDMDEPPF